MGGPVVCHYFLAGNCAKGEQCSYLHNAPSSVAPEIQVPVNAHSVPVNQSRKKNQHQPQKTLQRIPGSVDGSKNDRNNHTKVQKPASRPRRSSPENNKKEKKIEKVILTPVDFGVKPVSDLLTEAPKQQSAPKFTMTTMKKQPPPPRKSVPSKPIEMKQALVKAVVKPVIEPAEPLSFTPVSFGVVSLAELVKPGITPTTKPQPNVEDVTPSDIPNSKTVPVKAPKKSVAVSKPKQSASKPPAKSIGVKRTNPAPTGPPTKIAKPSAVVQSVKEVKPVEPIVEKLTDQIDLDDFDDLVDSDLDNLSAVSGLSDFSDSELASFV